MLITISATSSSCFGAKKFASWLFMMTHNTIYLIPERSDWCDNMPLRSYNYAPVLPVNVSRPYFSTWPPAGRTQKIWCLGTRLELWNFVELRVFTLATTNSFTIGEKRSIVTYNRSATPGKCRTTAILLVLFDRNLSFGHRLCFDSCFLRCTRP